MTEARAKSDGRVDLKALIEAAASFDSASPSEEIGAFTGDGSWRSLGTVADIRRLASTVAAMAEELMAFREAVKPADDPESILHALQIMSMATPYSDVQGQLYCHRPYSPDGYRDAEFRDYGLARAVRIICNNAKAIASSLQEIPHVQP